MCWQQEVTSECGCKIAYFFDYFSGKFRRAAKRSTEIESTIWVEEKPVKSHEKMSVQLKIWRQKSKTEKGEFVEYSMDQVDPAMSFLEMLDVLNQKLIKKGQEPIAFDHDCREGICGCCSFIINGNAHGPDRSTTACQLHMRRFQNGQTIVVEPLRAKAFPVLKDLIVDRSAFDRIIQAGGFISVNTGNASEAQALLVQKEKAEMAFESSSCIGCGACVSVCKNASAMLFVSAKTSHLGLLPQGRPEHSRRVKNMVEQMEKEGFGACTNTGACADACPKDIDLSNIARLHRDYLFAQFKD